MLDVLEISLYSIITIVFFYFIYVIVSLYFKNKKLYALVIQSQAERDHFRLKLAEQIARKDSKKLEQTDGFVRFISQSRDWAFDYIEKVQESIKELKDTRKEISTEDVLFSEKIKSFIDAVDKTIENLPKEEREDNV
jgi:vacuolar-type H+-ATPase subunit I/STV1